MSNELLQSGLFGHRRGALTGAISDRLGLLPAADGGTVFLDAISEVLPAFQVSLLRFLQEGEVKPVGTHETQHCNVRVIAASNRPCPNGRREANSGATCTTGYGVSSWISRRRAADPRTSPCSPSTRRKIRGLDQPAYRRHLA